jgi:hypothetical protein
MTSLCGIDKISDDKPARYIEYSIFKQSYFLTMPQYRNLPNGFIKIRNRLIIKIIPILSISVIAGLLINYQSNKNTHIDFSAWLIIALVLVCVLSYSVFKAVKKQKIIYNSYLLAIETNYLTREQDGLPLITIFVDDINEITKDKEGNLTIKTPDAAKQLTIPSSIESYDVVEKLMQSRCNITQITTKTFLQKFPFLLPLLTVALMVAVYTSNNKIIVLISGTAIVALLIWGLYEIRTSPKIDNATKNKAWWVLVVLASIIAVIYYKVFGS